MRMASSDAKAHRQAGIEMANGPSRLEEEARRMLASEPVSVYTWIGLAAFLMEE